MTAGTAFGILADLLEPVAAATAATAVAKAANSANRMHPRGSPTDSSPCEALRVSANPASAERATADDSQDFAELRRQENGPESEQRRWFSQDSQDSQEVPAAATSQACAGCAHRLRPGTCAEPVAAGLTEGFDIHWPPVGHGRKCAAWTQRPTAALVAAVPAAMSIEDGNRCHAGGWDDAEIARFTERRDRLMRWGWGEPAAETMAERLTLRDRDAEGRTICPECRHYRPGRCGNHHAAGLQSQEVGRDLAALLKRCPGFTS